MTIEEIYDESIKPLLPSERFRLATLILNKIPPQCVVDISDGWWRERGHRDACNEYGRCANRRGHRSLPIAATPDGSVCRGALEQQQIAGKWLGSEEM